MSKILVVESYSILKEHCSHFAPEHEVQIADEFPDTGAFVQGSYDILNIDAGTLRERNLLSDLNRRAQDWRIRTIWLEEHRFSRRGRGRSSPYPR
jgi:hypothetical protein